LLGLIDDGPRPVFDDGGETFPVRSWGAGLFALPQQSG